MLFGMSELAEGRALGLGRRSVRLNSTMIEEHSVTALPDRRARGRYWDIFNRLCIETESRGSRVTNAWFAALAIEWGCEWITLGLSSRNHVKTPGL